MTHRFFLFGDR